MGGGPSAPAGERPSSAAAFRLGDWVVEPALNLVTRGDHSAHVRRQLIDLLVFLASRGGQVVSKEEIFRAVWPGQFVAETGLARCISQLRDVFEDDPREPTVIQTIPTRGYRLLAPVQRIEPVTQSAPDAARPPAGAGLDPPSPALVAGERAPVTNVPAPRRRRPPAAAIAAGAALACALAGFGAWRILRPPAPAAQETLLVSFENRTGDPVFDDTLRLALAIQLEQSPYLRVVPEQRVREELGFMNRQPDEVVTRAVAMEMCERVGAGAVLTGSIARLGDQYVIGLEGAQCPSGRTLVRRQVEVTRKEEVIGRLGQEVSGVRHRLGESVASVQRNDVPLVQATTPSLEALKALSAGDLERGRGRDAEAVQAYQRAIEADPEFALAYGRLGVHLLSLTRTGEAIEALKRAFALRSRTSAGERLYITSYYYTRVVRDPIKAIEALETWRDRYPRNATPRISLGEMYIQVGRFADAVAEGREALRLEPGSATATAVVVEGLMGLERLDEAKRVAESLVAGGRGNVTTRVLLLLIAFAQDDPGGMRQQLDWAAAHPAAESLFATHRASIAMFGGRMREGGLMGRQRAERAVARGDEALAALTAAGAAFHEAFVGATEEVRELTSLALDDPGTPDVVLRSAFALALVGQADEAEQRLAQYSRMADVEAGSDPAYRAPTQALIDIERGRPDAAIELLEAVKPYELGVACIPTYVRGLAHMRAGRPLEAAAEFGTITVHRGALANALIYPVAWLQLARARAAAGDAPGA
ncbi:MAG TPA: winged helix-turn-helix domain-containing protein, partial [Vicinamibacterales bacterium]|nr:winged helix-turn-helix domain-containing protein [Vicinamibacterales bacterium]